MTRDRYKIIERNRPHFLTCTVVRWIPLFIRPEIVEIVLESLRHLQDQGHLILYGYVIMENHLHLLASADNLSKEMSRFKSFTARKIIDFLRERGEQGVLERLSDAKKNHAEHGNEKIQIRAATGTGSWSFQRDLCSQAGAWE